MSYRSIFAPSPSTAMFSRPSPLAQQASKQRDRVASRACPLPGPPWPWAPAPAARQERDIERARPRPGAILRSQIVVSEALISFAAKENQEGGGGGGGGTGSEKRRSESRGGQAGASSSSSSRRRRQNGRSQRRPLGFDRQSSTSFEMVDRSDEVFENITIF